MNYIIHYSIDDVIEVFRELTSTHPKSIFDISFFSFFRDLHEKYGLVLSCYCFFKRGNFSLAVATRDYKHEFEENSSWLRFGFHGYTGEEDYNFQNIEESKRQYTKVISNLKEIVGEKSLDTIPRVHRFHASKELVRWLGDNNVLSLAGLLSADDNRISYSLDSSENLELIRNHFIMRNNLHFFRTTQRFDALKPFMLKRLFANVGGQVILFTHEWLLVHPNGLKQKLKSVIIKELMKTVCKFYVKKGYVFSFPMDSKIIKK